MEERGELGGYLARKKKRARERKTKPAEKAHEDKLRKIKDVVLPDKEFEAQMKQLRGGDD